MYISGLTPPDLLNSFDTLFLHIKLRVNSQWNKRIEKAILILSAQQMVAGIGILVASFATLPTTLVADFHTLIYLAWMSSNGHLATLTLLRRYLQNNAAIRAMKLLTMVIFLAMLCAAIFPTTNFAWADHILIEPACQSASSCLALSTHALSLWHVASSSNLHGMLSPQGVISYVLLIVSYTWQASMLFKQTHSRIRHMIRKPLLWLEKALHLAAVQRLGPVHRHFNEFRYRLVLGLYLFMLALFDFVGSFACFLGVVTVGFAWANFVLLLPRLHVFPDCVRQTLNLWDFGQILPMLLFLGPFYSLVERCFRDKHLRSDTSQQSTSSSNPGRTSNKPKSSLFLLTRIVPSSPSQTDVDDMEQTLPNPQNALVEEIYSTMYFKVLLGLVCILGLGASVGYFVETTIALTGPSQPYSWYTRDWHLLPDVLAGGAAFMGIFLISLLGPFVSHRLSS